MREDIFEVVLGEVAVRTDFAERPREILKVVWEKLPKDARDSIAEYWKTSPRSCGQPPEINGWPVPIGGPNRGRTTGWGFIVELAEWQMNRGGEGAERLVAHELAHVHDWAGNGPTKDNPRWAEIDCERDPDATIQMEEYAATTADKWNFPTPSGESLDDYISRVRRDNAS